MLHITIGLAGLGVAALALGYFAGPPLVGLIFGQSYVLGGRDVALPRRRRRRLHRARPRHAGARGRGAAPARGVELAVGGRRWQAVILFTVPDLLLAAELAFLAGSATGWLVGTLLVLTTGRRERELQRA
jgi:hypothetical protein